MTTGLNATISVPRGYIRCSFRIDEDILEIIPNAVGHKLTISVHKLEEEI